MVIFSRSLFRTSRISGLLPFAVMAALLAVAAGTSRAQEYGPTLSPVPVIPPRVDVPPLPLEPPALASPAEKFPYLVTTEQTGLWIKEGNLRIVDVRSFLDFHLKGHIPGSVRMRWTDFVMDPDHGGAPLSDPYRISKAFQKLGYPGPEVRIIVAGDPRDEWDLAAYAVYAFRSWGHVRTSLMVGGVPFWKAQGRPVEHGFSSEPEPAWREVTANVQALEAAVLHDRMLEDRNLLLLDARTEAEYGGARLFGEPRGGHLPGARRFDPRRLMNSDGLILLGSVPQLMAEAGVFPSVPVVVYDYGGVKAALVWIVLKDAGFEQVSLFPGGFFEWSSRPELPLETAVH